MPLRPRLVLALFATAAATLAVAALALLPPLQARLRRDAARTLVLHAEAARPGFNRLRRRDVQSRSRRVDTLLRDVARTASGQAMLISSTGVSDDTDPDAPGTLADAQRVLVGRRSEHSVQNDVAYAAVPLRIDGRPYVLALRRRLGDVDRTVAVVETAFGDAALVGLALALVGGLLLSGRMLRRLRALRDAVAGERDVPPDTHRDELGDLSRAFGEMQDRLARQETARRTFVATASHELRTPLASLQTLLELAADEARSERPDLAAVRADVDEALAQARRLGGLSRGLLDLSRLDAEVALRSEPLELGELARAVAAEFRPAPSCAAADELCWALGDPDGVARIVRLLVDNALRHARAPVEVRTERRGDLAVVRVLDGGLGVPVAEREAVFERFRRGEASGAPGFGLGLAIGRELARRMGGELALEEGPPGPGEPPGARFALALPVPPADAVGESSSDPNLPQVALVPRALRHPSDPPAASRFAAGGALTDTPGLRRPPGI